MNIMYKPQRIKQCLSAVKTDNSADVKWYFTGNCKK